MNPDELAEQYIAVWNERDPELRSQRIAELWVPAGEHYVQSRKVVGYEELEQRVRESHDKWVRDAGNRFRAVPGARQQSDIVTFYWEMLPGAGDTVRGKGLEFVVVSDTGKILRDHQFYPA